VARFIEKLIAGLQRRFGGQSDLNDWLGQTNNEATVRGISQDLQPVQELMPFQRKFRDVDGDIAPDAGEEAQLTGIVPIGEMWRIHNVSVNTADSIAHTVSLRIQSVVNATAPYEIARLVALAGIDTPLFPAGNFVANNDGRWKWAGGPLPIALPQDTVIIEDHTTTATAARVLKISVRYEILPAPEEFNKIEPNLLARVEGWLNEIL